MLLSRREFYLATLSSIQSLSYAYSLNGDKLPEGAAETGAGLTMEEATSGWLSLFDFKTDYGWQNSTVLNNSLSGGTFTLPLSNCKIRLKSKVKSSIIIGNKSHTIEPNTPLVIDSSDSNTNLTIQSGSLYEVAILPLKLTPKLNGKDLSGWKEIIRKGKSPASWKVQEGKLIAKGGPAVLELEDQLFADMIIRIKVASNARHSNGGLFFRSIPGEFTNGYEAQIYSSCDDNDPAKPTKWATGAIDDRVQARRLISRDFTPFSMTVIALGPKIAVWVNGYQTVSWVDTREISNNPRKGLRLEAGSIQIQAHDPLTNIEIHELSCRHW